jgi:hypothetical protein
MESYEQSNESSGSVKRCKLLSASRRLCFMESVGRSVGRSVGYLVNIFIWIGQLEKGTCPGSGSWMCVLIQVTNSVDLWAIKNPFVAFSIMTVG